MSKKINIYFFSDGLHKAVVGQQARFRVELRDVRNFVLSPTTSTSSLTSTLVSRNQSSSSTTASTKTVVTFAPDKDGVVATYVAPTVAGAYALRVQVAGVDVPSSPFTVTIEPAATSGAHCTVSGPALAGATENVATSLVVRLADEHGNTRTASNEKVQCSVKTASDNTPVDAEVKRVDGQSVVSFTPRSDAALLADVTVNGTRIKDSPFKINVAADPERVKAQRKAAELAEQKRKAEEVETKRKAKADEKRRADEAEAKRIADEVSKTNTFVIF